MSWLELLKEFGPLAYAWIKKRFAKEKILILGCGGVGKTTLGMLLEDSMSLLKQQPGYEESFDTDAYRMRGLINATVYTVAGQQHRRESTWKELLDEVRNGSITGIVVMNAYGYHSIGPSGLVGEPIYRELAEQGKDDEFLAAYLTQKRREELEVLTYIAPYLQARATGDLWMLSLITKEDLWFDNRDEVLQFYTNGEYEEQVREIQSSLGTRQFRHELVTMSLSISNFETGKSEPLAKYSESYDQHKQAESARRYFQALSGLCKEAK